MMNQFFKNHVIHLNKISFIGATVLEKNSMKITVLKNYWENPGI